jgi:hypothetical protein
MRLDSPPTPTISGADPERVPEDYYSYLEGWYRSQVKAVSQASKTGGSLPSLHSSVPTSFPYIPPTTATASSNSTSHLTVSLAGSGGNHHPGLFIPVAALQGLRSSLPGQLPQLTTGMAVVRNTRTEPVLVNLLRSAQESILSLGRGRCDNPICRTGPPPGYIDWWNRFLGSTNVYKYRLWLDHEPFILLAINHNPQDFQGFLTIFFRIVMLYLS